MADFRIVIQVDPSRAKSGTRQVESALDRVGASADRLRNLIRRTFTFTAIALGVRQLVNLTDTFTNLQNRLRVVTKGTATLAVVTDELFEAANRTRSSFRGTAELFTRVSLATREMGISQRQAIQFTESVNKAILLSGASAREANAGLIQLSQGLASNTLRGDELRSVLEQLPVVADVIAKSMGITRGELREMGQEGKISAAIVLQAFKEARLELDERFKKVIPTIGQSFEVFKNNLVRFIGELNTSVGVAGGLSKAILFLAENMETLGRVAGAVGITLAVTFTRKGVLVAAAGIRTLTAAMLANPFLAFAAAVLAVTSALITFSDKIKVSADGIVNLGDWARAAFNVISEKIKPVIRLFREGLSKAIAFVRSLLTLFGLDFSDLLIIAKNTVGNMIGFFFGMARAYGVIFEEIRGFFTDTFSEESTSFIKTVFQGIVDFVQERVKLMIAVVGTAFSAVRQLADQALEGTDAKLGLSPEAVEEAKAFGDKVAEAFARGMAEGQAVVDSVVGLSAEIDIEARRIAEERIKRLADEEAAAERARKALEIARKAAERATPGLEARAVLLERELDLLKKQGEALKLIGDDRKVAEAQLKIEQKLFKLLQKANKELSVTELNRLAKLSAAEVEALDAIVRHNLALERQADILFDIQKPQIELVEGLKALDALFAKEAITIGQYNDKLRELRIAALETARDAESGFERGLLKIQEEFTNTAVLAENALVNAFQAGEDALVEFVTTGKLSFSSLIDSIMADLARLAIRQAITGPLADALQLNGGGGGGGGGGGVGGFFKKLFMSAGESSGGGGGGGGGDLFGGLLQAAHGGGFNVTGRSGVDRNTMSINGRPVAKVTKGERVEISPTGGGGRPIRINFNITTPDVEGFRRNEGRITARLSQTLQASNRRNN